MLTEVQKKARRQGIGGSDVGIITGHCSWKTRYELYIDKIGEGKEQPDNDYMRQGREAEPEIAREYEIKTGSICIIDDQTYTHKSHSFMKGHVDRLIKNQNGLLECKWVGNYDSFGQWGEEGTDQIPRNYLLQVAHYAAVVDVEWVDIMTRFESEDKLFGKLKTHKLYRYIRNYKLEEKMIKAERDFWVNHVQERVAPEPTTPPDIAHYYRKTNGKPIEADEAMELRMQSLHKLKKEVKEKNNEADELRLEINTYMGHHDELVDCKGKVLATWKKTKTRTKIDERKLYADLPDIFNKYNKETECSRVFRMGRK